ncbi:MAG: McrC family protein [gamma proteobacterium symbiont of Bathyaustriella thionipta]|nr:McrC family protein [gamma proteobacterium symbiont of Bathyaustriella thionipta]MCU7950916.1 McrC family protein [gamma proteobacterium symbiont of Bathyaustriella thionipta]MCU7954453.1 McrC family protein [gamma proteobacterium symbiont of Bathyaustriella thionipta]MCU7957407.1 McrC family protein [gamma proteobacterium symbiont of Bathyaustriella thionipta]MCU7967360.1 McrC family protein [gamma proteobacterium symbiont of Bathyaustriella thionipta]
MQVREYALLTTDQTAHTSLDVGVISPTTYDWLVDISRSWQDTERQLIIENQKVLKLGSYVGFLQSPTGESIEILPKTDLGQQNSRQARTILQNMLQSALHLPAREYGQANLLRMDTPIHEWIYSQFLTELKTLNTKGLRFHYNRIEQNSYFIRGQLDIIKQQRQPPGKAHLFHIRHDVFSPDRLENRLIKTALDYVHSQCQQTENWRLANELSHQLSAIEAISQPLDKLNQWQMTKLTRHYELIRPWCKLILEKLNPNFQKGQHKGIALLFPMQRLYEDYVAVCLNTLVSSPWTLKTQAATEHLLTHQSKQHEQSKPWFQLKPDLLLQKGAMNQVMDCKWKLIDASASNTDTKYNIHQADLYQLFAYGQKYQQGSGHMMLIYPKHHDFENPLPPFYFSDELVLWAVPFCLESSTLIPGNWIQFFPALGLINYNSQLKAI